jgi:hypothetical protein
MMYPPDIQIKLAAIIQYLSKLGVTVTLTDGQFEEVTIAQLRNQHIVINSRSRDGLNCIFTIAHLFGHLVQFLGYEKYAHLTTRVEGPMPVAVDEDFRQAFYKYEIEAFRIGKGLMSECFDVPLEMDSKYNLFLETDFAHFWHFITTGERGDSATFNRMLAEAYKGWTSNRRALSPLPHPKPICLNRSALVDVV